MDVDSNLLLFGFIQQNVSLLLRVILCDRVVETTLGIHVMAKVTMSK